jgi:hypothetical protein
LSHISSPSIFYSVVSQYQAPLKMKQNPIAFYDNLPSTSHAAFSSSFNHHNNLLSYVLSPLFPNEKIAAQRS